MRRLLLLTYLLISFMLVSTAQTTTWEKLFSARGTDVFRSVVEVPSGGYIAAGYTSDISLNDTDAYVVKLNTSGDTAWTFKYNGPLSFKDLLYKVIPTTDGGFAFCGYTTSVTGVSDDVMFMKLNASGELQWVKYWGGSGKDRAQDIIELPNGNFAIVGYTTSVPAQYYDAFILVTDNQGNLINSKLYGSFGYDDANAVQLLGDGGFILGGQSYNGAQGLDQFLIRLNSSLDTIWTKKFGTANTDNIESVLVTSDGFVMTGNTSTLTTGDDGCILKTDTAGKVLWTKTFGGSSADDFHTVKATTGGFILCGTTRSYGALNPNLWLVKTNTLGDSLWARTFGGDNHDHGYSVATTSDGGYVLVGHSGSYGWNQEEAMIIKTDSSGNVYNKLKYTSVIALVEPKSANCGGQNTQIKVVIRNFGEVSVAGVPITVEISGALNTTLTHFYPWTFAPGETDTVTLSTTINTSGIGTYTFKCYTNNNNDVSPSRNSFSSTFMIEGYAPSPTVTNNSRCGQGTVTLNANSISSIYWFNAATGGASINSGNSYVTPSISSNTTYFVQSGLNCPSSRVPITASIISTPLDPVTTSAQLCGPGMLTLSASSQDSVTWYDSVSGGNVVGAGSNYTTPSLLSSATFYAQSGTGNCKTNRIPAVATINTAAVDPVTASDNRCGSGTLTLSANSPDPIVWFDLPSGGNTVGNGSSFLTPSLSTTAVYYAQAYNANCQSARIPAQAMIYTVPSVNLGNDTMISNTTALTLNAGTGTNTYQWTTGETTESITVSVTGTYCVTVTSAENCSNSDCILIDISTGIHTSPNEKTIAVYPNPTIGKCTVSIPSNIASVDIELIDSRGALVNRFTGSQITEIDLTAFPKGVYWLKIKSDNSTSMQKIVLM